VRDAAAHLPGCLESLGRQTLVDHEVVAVDDGSADGSGELLDRAAARDPRLQVLHTPPQGLVAALNAGLERCQAPVVARMDADDVCHPRRLELQVAMLDERPEVGVASCLARHFPRRGVGEGFRVYERWLNSLVEPEEIFRERFVESPLPHPSAAIRRELLDRCGGWRDPGWPEDYDLWLRLLEAGVTVAKVPRTLLFWREHPGRLTRTDPRYAVERFLRCKAHFLLTGPLAGCPRVVMWGAGQTGRRLSRHLLRGGAPLEAVVDIDPNKVGGRLRGVPIVPPDALPELLAPGTVVLAAVASRGARVLIRSQLDGLGLVEGGDYWCVA
jgi:GT2 family glycosyltransferase